MASHYQLPHTCHGTLAGELEFSHKEGLEGLPEGYYPWFNLPNPSLKNTRILFGHWAALEGNGPQAPVIALDGGCVWGGQLLAYRLDHGCFFSATDTVTDALIPFFSRPSSFNLLFFVDSSPSYKHWHKPCVKFLIFSLECNR